jgi:hypothetical protein
LGRPVAIRASLDLDIVNCLARQVHHAADLVYDLSFERSMQRRSFSNRFVLGDERPIAIGAMATHTKLRLGKPVVTLGRLEPKL